MKVLIPAALGLLILGAVLFFVYRGRPPERPEPAGAPKVTAPMKKAEPGSGSSPATPGAGSSREEKGTVAEETVTLRVKLLGPKDEPIEGGRVFLKLEAPEDRGLFQPVEREKALREAKDVGAGEYVLESVSLKPQELLALAPGYSWTSESIEVPREGIVTVHLGESCRITGIVRSVDGKPIEGAEITVSGFLPLLQRTDGSGRFSLDVPRETVFSPDPDGGNVVIIIASAEGFASTQKDVSQDDLHEIEFWLYREAVISGRVISQEDSSPIPDAEVYIFTDLDLNDASHLQKTDAQGRFEIEKVPPGPCRMFVDNETWIPEDLQPLEIQEGARISDMVIRLEKGFHQSGKVVEAGTGSPISEAEVFLGGRSAKTDSKGSFKVIGLKEGECSIRTSAKGYLDSSETAFLRPGDKDDLTVSLYRGGSVSGRVLDLDGNPISEARVHLDALESKEEGIDPQRLYDILKKQWTITDSNGGYRFDGLIAHPGYIALARHEEYVPGNSQPFSVVQGKVTEGIDIQLLPGGRFHG